MSEHEQMMLGMFITSQIWFAASIVSESVFSRVMGQIIGWAFVIGLFLL